MAMGALAMAFLVFVPSMAVASMMMFSVFGDLPGYVIWPRPQPPLSFKTIKSADSFDAWLLMHGRQPTVPHPRDNQH